MSDWLCVKCLREFANGPEIKRQPEYVGMAIFILIGIGCIVLGIGAVVFAREYAFQGGILALAGLGAIGFGWRLKTGVKAICPNCGKPQGIAGNTKSADEIRRRGRKN